MGKHVSVKIKEKDGWYVAVIEEIGYEGYWYTVDAAELAIKAYNCGLTDAGSINRYVNTRRADGVL